MGYWQSVLADYEVGHSKYSLTCRCLSMTAGPMTAIADEAQHGK